MTDRSPLTRREMLGSKLFGTIARHLATALEDRVNSIAHAVGASDEQPPALLPTGPVLHRPPCAIEELSFTAQCTRCDACLHACPPGAIKHADAVFAKAAGTPVIDSAATACIMCADAPCVAACVAEGTSVLHPSLSMKMGTARIIKQNCDAHQGRACDACVVACPVEHAIELRGNVPVISTHVCTGCGMCREVCPASRNAVAIIPLAERPPMPITPQSCNEITSDE